MYEDEMKDVAVC